MEIKRDIYLNRLIRRECNGLIKIVTGVQIATFCGQQGRISRTIRAILSGQL